MTGAANDNTASDIYFGACPGCGRSDGYLNDGPDHWFICVEHRLKWRVGMNLFSDWRDETQVEKASARWLLRTFSELSLQDAMLFATTLGRR